VTNNAIDGTFHGFTGRTDGNRIDYVFHNADSGGVSGTLDHVSWADPLVGTRYRPRSSTDEAVLRSTVPEPSGGVSVVTMYAASRWRR